MIPKSGYRFSEKDHAPAKAMRAEMELLRQRAYPFHTILAGLSLAFVLAVTMGLVH
jgi:hypothetical protein